MWASGTTKTAFLALTLLAFCQCAFGGVIFRQGGSQLRFDTPQLWYEGMWQDVRLWSAENSMAGRCKRANEKIMALSFQFWFLGSARASWIPSDLKLTPFVLAYSVRSIGSTRHCGITPPTILRIESFSSSILPIPTSPYFESFPRCNLPRS